MSRPPRPHPLARAPLVDRLNGWLEGLWRKGWATRPSLDPEELWRKGSAGQHAGDEFSARSEEDAEDFRLRLDRLTSALQSEAQLNPLGLTMAHGQLVRAIRHRFQLGRLWREKRELLEDDLTPPILVVGHMRSGTTRVHRLLAADPAHAATRFCDSWHPVPRSPDLRPMWSAMALGFAHRLDPWLDTLHPFGATRPDEELGWLATSLDHCAYEAQWHVPSFVSFSEQRDPAPVYREFHRLLKTDAHWHGNASRPRVLKVPQFAEDLPALLALLPDASVVRTCRKKEDVLESAVSLVANQRTIQSDSVDLETVRRDCTRKIALREARMDEALASFDGPVVHVDFAEIGRDWEGAMTRVYDALGLLLKPETRSIMAKEQSRGHGGAHRQHRSAIEAFAGT